MTTTRRWVYCRHATSLFWHWAFHEGTRDLSKTSLGTWVPKGIVEAATMSEAVELGRTGQFTEIEETNDA